MLINVLEVFCIEHMHLRLAVGVDRLSAWPIIGADIKHFYDYRYRPFSKQFYIYLHLCI